GDAGSGVSRMSLPCRSAAVTPDSDCYCCELLSSSCFVGARPPFHDSPGVNRLLNPIEGDRVLASRDADSFPFEHGCDGAGWTADLESRAAQPLERLDSGAVDEADASQIDTHRARGEKQGTFELQQGGPLRRDSPFEPQRHPRA